MDQFTGITGIGYVLLHEVPIMGRYVTNTYQLHEKHVCAQGWYVTTAYQLNTVDDN